MTNFKKTKNNWRQEERRGIKIINFYKLKQNITDIGKDCVAVISDLTSPTFIKS